MDDLGVVHHEWRCGREVVVEMREVRIDRAGGPIDEELRGVARRAWGLRDARLRQRIVVVGNGDGSYLRVGIMRVAVRHCGVSLVLKANVGAKIVKFAASGVREALRDILFRLFEALLRRAMVAPSGIGAGRGGFGCDLQREIEYDF